MGLGPSDGSQSRRALAFELDSGANRRTQMATLTNFHLIEPS